MVIALACGNGTDPRVTGVIAPNLQLAFDWVEFTVVQVLGAASPGGQIACCGTPIDADDMKLAGTGA